MKSIIKEIFIIILLIIAVLMALGILFYNYNPFNREVPSKAEAYIMPEEISTELDATIEASETQNIIKTYRIDASDLRGYERTNDYDKGKINPFDEIGSDGTRKNTSEGEAQEGGLSEGKQGSTQNPSTGSTQGKFGVDGNK